ncbi:hypothetical protein U5B43_08900 [Campylobacter sp. 9BO]|uniref:hypothetical protein n=1 Tax=Campylobacter sp. 9BO TaxID=3424759 RepID=UPI003D32DF85
MTKKQFSKILREICPEPTVKVLRSGAQKPGYERMCYFAKRGIPFEAWQDIRSWLKEQEKVQKCNS